MATRCVSELTLRPDEVPNEYQNLIHGPGQQEKEHSLPREEQRQFVSDLSSCSSCAVSHTIIPISDLNSCSSCAVPHTITPISLICPFLSTVVCREIMSPFHFIVTRFFLSDSDTQYGQRNSSVVCWGSGGISQVQPQLGHPSCDHKLQLIPLSPLSF